MGPFLLILSCSSLLVVSSSSYDYTSDWESFNKYTKDYNKPYTNDINHMKERFEIFKESLLRHKWLNEYESQNGGNAKYGVNKFSDLSPKEFAELYLSGHLPSPTGEEFKLSPLLERSSTGMVQEFDWRDENVITPIKDQKRCGSCWAFSVVESIESKLSIETKSPPVELSVQQLISCDYNPDKLLSGCSGGAIYWAFNTTETMPLVLVPASDYPFSSGDGNTGNCRNDLPNKGVTLLDFTYNSDIDESVIMQYVTTNGPTSNSVSAALWQDYDSGIIQHHCTSNPLDHAIQIVGFNMTGVVPYWIVRNTWGTDWGEGGFVRLKYGDNTCGLAEEVATVEKVSSNM